MVGWLNVSVGVSDLYPDYRTKKKLSVHDTSLNPLRRNMHMSTHTVTIITAVHQSVCRAADAQVSENILALTLHLFTAEL